MKTKPTANKRSVFTGRKRAAIQEAGHWVAAHRYGLARRAYIFKANDSKGKPSWTGQAENEEATPFRSAVIGWVGLVAEDSTHEFNDQQLAYLKEHFDEFLAHEEKFMSETDREMIERYPDRWKPYLEAVKIIRSNTQELAKIYNLLLERESVDVWNFDPSFGVPKRVWEQYLKAKAKHALAKAA